MAFGRGGILNNDVSAVFLDASEAGCSVPAHACQKHTHNTLAECLCCGLEENINRWARVQNRRIYRQAKMVAFDKEVIIRRANVDASSLHGVLVFDFRYRQSYVVS